MSGPWIKRVVFGIASVWMLVLAAQSYAQAGLVAATAVDTGIGLVMMVLAITAKGG
jgi:hypothetical protein